MIRRSLGRTLVLAGLAGLVLAGAPVPAAIGSEGPASPPGLQNAACANSTTAMQQLATIDNAGDGSFQCLGLALDGDRVAAIRVETHHVSPTGQHAASDKIKIEEFPLAVVESRRGAVLDGVPGHDAIVLRGRFSKPSDKAELVTSYLYNGFTNEYRSCQITLDRAPNAGWRLVNRFNQIISHIVVRTREIPLIGTFGIADLEGACTPPDR